MAGKRLSAIEVIDLSQLALVRGGDKQTEAARLAIAKATTEVEEVARNAMPRNAAMTEALFQMIGNRRSGSGPSSAPALPPTSTLTR